MGKLGDGECEKESMRGDGMGGKSGEWRDGLAHRGGEEHVR